MTVKTVEQRLTAVEHKVTENASRIDGLHEAIAELGNRMDRRFEAMEQRFDRRFEAIATTTGSTPLTDGSTPLTDGSSG